MPQMTKAEVSYFLDRLLLFKNTKQLCEAMGVTYPTAIRWIDGETLPSTKLRGTFEKALEDMLEELDGRGPLGKRIADVLEAESPPEPRAASIIRLPIASRKGLKELIGDVLADGKWHKSTKITKAAQAAGWNRVSVQTTASKMGVEKNHIGKGRNSYSLWRMK